MFTWVNSDAPSGRLVYSVSRGVTRTGLRVVRVFVGSFLHSYWSSGSLGRAYAFSGSIRFACFTRASLGDVGFSFGFALIHLFSRKDRRFYSRSRVFIRILLQVPEFVRVRHFFARLGVDGVRVVLLQRAQA